MKKVVISGSNLRFKEKEVEILKDIAMVSIIESTDKADLIETAKDAHGILVDLTKIDKEVIENCKNLECIVYYGEGIDAIDLKAATENKIIVCNVPGVLTRDVAEFTVALIFALSKKICEVNYDVKYDFIWNFNRYSPVRLKGKKVGIFGFGKIGKLVANLLKNLVSEVFICDPYVKENEIIKMEFQPATMDQILNFSNIISLHIPLNNETRHLINKESFSKMLNKPFLINVSRGEIIDEVALIEALKSNLISGFATDVLKNEPIIKNHPLSKFKNVIITPHMAWKSDDSEIELEVKAASEMKRVLSGQKPLNQVNIG